MKKSAYSITSMALLLGLALSSGAAMANARLPTADGAPASSKMLQSAVKIMRSEHRRSLKKQLKADWKRMSALATEEMQNSKLAGGPVNDTVKSAP